MHVPLVHKEAPQFGLDIGARTIKVVQLNGRGPSATVKGYGNCFFPSDAITEGIISDPKAIAEAIRPLLKKLEYGSISAKRAVVGLPATKLFTRVLQLPPMNEADLNQAINYEVEQYVPVPLADLYIDHEAIASAHVDGQQDVLMVAAPRAIVDSYIRLLDELHLEIAAIEANMMAVARSLRHSGDASASSLVMDIGSTATDLAIYDRLLPLTGSVPIGGENITSALVDGLNIKLDQANEIKAKFGIAKSGMHDKILPPIKPHLDTILKEVHRMIKYYEDRGSGQKVSSMVISGGTADMPGLADYLREQVGLPLTTANPWRNIGARHHATDATTAPFYATAIGLALREEA